MEAPGNGLLLGIVTRIFFIGTCSTQFSGLKLHICECEILNFYPNDFPNIQRHFCQKIFRGSCHARVLVGIKIERLAVMTQSRTTFHLGQLRRILNIEVAQGEINARPLI